MHAYPATDERDIVRTLLAPERVLVRECVSDRWAAIGCLTDLLVQAGKLSPAERETAYRAVVEREKQSSTALGRGFAIPHGVHDALDREVGALGVFRKGVDFAARDGRPTYVVLLLLYPYRAREEHLSNVAAAIRTLAAPTLIEALTAAEDAGEAYRLLRCKGAHGH
ncbi:MAG: hypothetical protein KatS3mg115_0056 [Candidatus Poribacteria bacterium]|nr:MAG: hypothetical protein KatS3mg115_0056 [Candidatus Poribacteria bacterium]